MKKINDNTFKNLKFKIRKGQANDLYDALHDLNIGEHLFLGKDEWKLNSDPRSLISNSQHMIGGLLVGYRFSIKQKQK